MRTKNNSYFQIITQFITEYKHFHFVSPTIREISLHTEIPRATVARYLKQLKETGEIEYSGHRNIKTVQSSSPFYDFINIPLLGSVSCGLPKFSEENIEQHIPFPTSLIGTGPFYLLHASGDSMIEAGIHDQDLVLIRQQNYAHEGQIVVALVNDEVTLKRFFPEPKKNRIRLQPENKNMAPIFVKNCEIQGIAVKVLKNLD